MDAVPDRNRPTVSCCLGFPTSNLVIKLTDCTVSVYCVWIACCLYFRTVWTSDLGSFKRFTFFLPELLCEEPETENCIYASTGCAQQIVTNETQQTLTSWNTKDGPGIFPCTMCGKVYRYYRNLHTHRRECGQEPRFHCPYCSLRTKTKSNLKRHIRLKHWMLSSVTWLYVGGRSWFHKFH
jgi:hypothetical protein